MHCVYSDRKVRELKQILVSAGLSSAAMLEILTLQGAGINEMDGAGDTDAYTHLAHVSEALCQPR